MNTNTFYSLSTKETPELNIPVSQVYHYEEVNLSTIKMGDVIILSDKAELPFWTPKKITDQKILFVPCAISEIVGAIDNLEDEDDETLWKLYKFIYTNKPEKSIMDVSYHNATFLICSCRHHDNKVKNKLKILKNGDRQEIKVRKYTGTPNDMKVRCIATMVIAQKIKYKIPKILLDFSDITQL